MSRHMVILSPVMPIWDHGIFCSSFTKLCSEKGFQTTLLDTLSLFPNDSSCGNSTVEILSFMTEKLKMHFKEPSILVGFSMAGMLVQVLAARLQNVQALLAVNAPGYPDVSLRRRIGYILSFLKNKDLSSALDALNTFMLPRGVMMKKRILLEISDTQKNLAMERMKKGFKLLLGMDARGEITKYVGKFLALVGEKSQLATVDNQTNSHCINHEYKTVPDAGTRLWDDNPVMTNKILSEWMGAL